MVNMSMGEKVSVLARVTATLLRTERLPMDRVALNGIFFINERGASLGRRLSVRCAALINPSLIKRSSTRSRYDRRPAGSQVPSAGDFTGPTHVPVMI
ncbi:hypothetical protein EVAR_92882_1 [Eumeta japonica]|uniref:Uncharacterized protein n=1 Tax=Eumeta variegata TaxID=151549 RepID=A0A4C1TCQ3_EUMVA|nr:hypothetical protein EVAR_92882_1 [Eumeta japonica]